jgi:hypothetical protein
MRGVGCRCRASSSFQSITAFRPKTELSLTIQERGQAECFDFYPVRRAAQTIGDEVDAHGELPKPPSWSSRPRAVELPHALFEPRGPLRCARGGPCDRRRRSRPSRRRTMVRTRSQSRRRSSTGAAPRLPHRRAAGRGSACGGRPPKPQGPAHAGQDPALVGPVAQEPAPRGGDGAPARAPIREASPAVHQCRLRVLTPGRRSPSGKQQWRRRSRLRGRCRRSYG